MIGGAKQSGNTVYVYNEKGKRIFSKSGTLVGYTSSNISVQRNNTIYIYDAKGRLIKSYNA